MTSMTDGLIILTGGLVGVTAYYAWQTRKLVNTTVEIARKEREIRWKEAELHRICQPIFEIFHLAKYEDDPKNRPRPPKDSYFFQPTEKKRIRNIMIEYGGYLDSPLLDLLHKKFIDVKQEHFSPTEPKGRFKSGELDEIYQALERKIKQLKNQLKKLIK